MFFYSVLFYLTGSFLIIFIFTLFDREYVVLGEAEYFFPILIGFILRVQLYLKKAYDCSKDEKFGRVFPLITRSSWVSTKMDERLVGLFATNIYR